MTGVENGSSQSMTKWNFNFNMNNTRSPRQCSRSRQYPSPIHFLLCNNNNTDFNNFIKRFEFQSNFHFDIRELTNLTLCSLHKPIMNGITFSYKHEI